MSRADKVEIVRDMRAKGMLIKEIQERTGFARSTIASYIDDPDLVKQRARRAKYSRPCIECGKPTDGSGGLKIQRTRCNSCWTQSLIAVRDSDLDYVRLRYVEHRVGVATIAAELGVSAGSVWTALDRMGIDHRRHELGSWTVIPVAEAIERYRAGESTNMLANDYGVHPSSVVFQLEGHGVKIRTASESQILRQARERAAR